MPVTVTLAAAAAVALVHLALVLFLVGGGFLVRRRRRVLWAHLAVAAAVLAVAVARAPCPLTELELWLLELAGDSGYRGGFIEHYFVRPVHPAGITPTVQVVIHTLVLAPNLLAYGRLVRHRTPSPAAARP
jgi:hypothetical protein